MRAGPLALALLAAGCCPVPIPDEEVAQPAVSFVVTDEAGAPVSNATIVFLAGTDPHHQLHEVQTHEVDASGRLSLPEVVIDRKIFPLMMHGVPFFYWEWCAMAPGYGAVKGRADTTSGEIAVTLPRREGEQCKQDGGRLFATGANDEAKAPPAGAKAPPPGDAPGATASASASAETG